MLFRALSLLAIASIAGTACSRDKEVRCSGQTLYLGAETIGQLRIPDDLTVPDETEAMRVPSTQGDALPMELPTECLEYSPAFRGQAADSDEDD